MTAAAASEQPSRGSATDNADACDSAVSDAALPTWLAPLVISLLAALLRAAPWLAGYPLHRDEALYGYWGRLIASGQDPLLLTPWIDKPPLSLYLIAGSMSVLGVSERSLRLPGMLASILVVPVVYLLARRAHGESTARLAALLLALSPFAILFAPTAFTDPWLTLWLVLAAWMALAKRGLAAGAVLGLAMASKQQGVLGVPLVIGLLLMPTADDDPHARTQPVLRSLLAAGVGFAAVLGLLTYWDSLRWHNRPSLWDRSLETYGLLGVAAPSELPGRATEWGRQLGYLFGVPLLSWLLLGLAAAVGVAAARVAMRHGRSGRGHRFDRVLAGYVAGYLALHVVVTVQPWDRYLLPLTPLVCILAARGLLSLADRVPPRNQVWRSGAGLILAAMLGYTAWLGAAGRVPVGSDHGAYTGIAQVAGILRDQPAEAIIYHQSLGWYFDYYLFDTPQERRWYDSGGKLAADAARTAEVEPQRPQWLVLPGWEVSSLQTLIPSLAARGLMLSEMAQVQRPDGTRSFELYRIMSLVAGGEP